MNILYKEGDHMSMSPNEHNGCHIGVRRMAAVEWASAVLDKAGDAANASPALSNPNERPSPQHAIHRTRRVWCLL